MITSGKPLGGFAESVEKVVQLLREKETTKRAGVTAEAVVDIANQVKTALGELAQAPVTSQMLAVLFAIGNDGIQTRFEERRLDPCQAAEPARHMLRVYESYRSGSASLRALASDKRFHWMSKPFRRLEVRIPPYEFKAQVIALEGIFGTALWAAELAAGEVFRLRDPLVRLGATPGDVPAPAVLNADYLVKLPRGPFTTERQRMRSMRRLLFRIANELHQAARLGQETLMSAALDDELTAVQPEVVSGAVKGASFTIACGLLTCAALWNLLSEPTLAESQRTAVASNGRSVERR
jgi:hypothetical protein